MDLRQSHPLRGLLKGWLISFVVFGLLAGLIAGQFALTSNSFSWPDAARRTLRDWVPWALVAPLIFFVVSRLPLFAARWWVVVPAHLACAIAVFFFCQWWSESVVPRRPPPWAANRPPASSSYRRPPERSMGSDPRPSATQPGGGLAPEQQPRAAAESRPPLDPQPDRSRPRPAGGPHRNPWDAWFFIGFLTIYLAILSVAHALHFYRRSQARERRSLELESGLTQARLDALRMQLQPHFLFNSLNAIAALIHKDPDAADEMVAALSDFLRLTLERPAEQEMSLRRELEFVERYLAIEKVRFGERLHFSFDIPADTFAALVPTLMLQPLVENAVRHGLEPKVEGGTLTITARREEERLVLSIADDGAGIRQHPPREGIGLYNTRARLSELYGKAASLRMESGTGVEVRISLPFHTAVAAA